MENQSHEMRVLGEEASRNAQTSPKTPTARELQRSQSRSSSITMREPAVQELHLTAWPLLVVGIYSALVLFPWIIFCTTTDRNFFYSNSRSFYSDDEDALKTLERKKSFVKAATIVQAVATLLTIPVTSSICSMAWVAYIQSSNLRTKLNLRQTMALADQGWLSPRVWTHVAHVGSLPFYLAFGLTCIGSIFQIFQSAVMERKTMTIPTAPNTASLPDIVQMMSARDTFLNTNVMDLRNILETARDDDYEPYLWNNFNDLDTRPIYQRDVHAHEWNDYTRALSLIGTRNKNLDESTYYFAPLPATFKAGTIPWSQYAPRINTTIIYQNITDQGFPKDCTPDMNGIYTEYSYQAADSMWSYLKLAVCMPNTNISASPWNSTYDRQELTEELYLKLNISTMSQYYGDTIFKATARSTLGYFELPNDRNDNRAGPLLDTVSMPDHQTRFNLRRRDNSKRQTWRDPIPPIDFTPMNTSQTLSPNLGPLTTITLALFGEDSFIQSRLTHPGAYVAQRQQIQEDGFNRSASSGNCKYTAPMTPFLAYTYVKCIRDYYLGAEKDVVRGVSEWAANFYIEETMRKALTTAAFLANKNWLKPTGLYIDNASVDYSSGEQLEVPFVALGSMFVGYTLVVAHLVGLFGLAFYIIVRKIWAPTLGSEIMVKIGTAYANELRHSKGIQEWTQATGSLPGFVGDAAPSERVGKIELGAREALNRSSTRKFECL